MAIENEDSYTRNPDERARGRTAELAARLAPVEERQNTATASAATSSFKLSKVFLEEDYGASRSLRPHPVVLVILGLVLAFIGFITYLISTAPSE